MWSKRHDNVLHLVGDGLEKDSLLARVELTPWLPTHSHPRDLAAVQEAWGANPKLDPSWWRERFLSRGASDVDRVAAAALHLLARRDWAAPECRHSQ